MGSIGPQKSGNLALPRWNLAPEACPLLPTSTCPFGTSQTSKGRSLRQLASKKARAARAGTRNNWPREPGMLRFLPDGGRS